jgi:Tfp pilus assembly protein PilF
LSERDRARAAALLDNYDATKVLGVLDREALLLRVELSLARGDRPGAQALAEQFERSYPTDAHIPRLRALLAGAAKKNDSPR